jgi:hypothetical protein
MIPDGFTSELDLQWLEQQALTHTAIVEIGCWIGRSTSVLAKTSGFVLCIDDWQGTDHGFMPTDIHNLPDGGLPAFAENMKDKLGKVIPFRLPSQQAATLFPLPCFDMVFIDGDHRYRSVWYDIIRWTRLLKKGGLLCGHNYEDCWKKDVVRAVDELIPDRQLVPNTSLWWKVMP